MIKTSKKYMDCEEKEESSRASSEGGSSWKLEESSTARSTNDVTLTGTTDEELQNINSALTKKESQQVFVLRAFVMLILLTTAASISLTIFHLERNSQVEQFETDYYATADKVIDVLQQVTESISAVSGLVLLATANTPKQVENSSSGAESFSGWPFITVDMFQERAYNARSLAGSIYISINPIVQMDQLSAWEKYVQSAANSWM